MFGNVEGKRILLQALSSDIYEKNHEDHSLGEGEFLILMKKGKCYKKGESPSTLFLKDDMFFYISTSPYDITFPVDGYSLDNRPIYGNMTVKVSIDEGHLLSSTKLFTSYEYKGNHYNTVVKEVRFDTIEDMLVENYKPVVKTVLSRYSEESICNINDYKNKEAMVLSAELNNGFLLDSFGIKVIGFTWEQDSKKGYFDYNEDAIDQKIDELERKRGKSGNDEEIDKELKELRERRSQMKMLSLILNESEKRLSSGDSADDIIDSIEESTKVALAEIKNRRSLEMSEIEYDLQINRIKNLAEEEQKNHEVNLHNMEARKKAISIKVEEMEHNLENKKELDDINKKFIIDLNNNALIHDKKMKELEEERAKLETIISEKDADHAREMNELRTKNENEIRKKDAEHDRKIKDLEKQHEQEMDKLQKQIDFLNGDKNIENSDCSDDEWKCPVCKRWRDANEKECGFCHTPHP